MECSLASNILAALSATRSNRRDATDVRGLAIWHGRAKNALGAVIVLGNTNDRTASQALNRDALSAADHTRQETETAKEMLMHPPPNDYHKPSPPTVEHHEVTTTHGSAH
jgi:hypothetical protein